METSKAKQCRLRPRDTCVHCTLCAPECDIFWKLPPS